MKLSLMPTWGTNLSTFIFSRYARPLRFLCTGGTAAIIQLGLLQVLTKWAGIQAFLANLIAFLISAQINFLMSSLFTWKDRQATRKTLVQRWLVFHGAISGTAALNMGMFAIAHLFMPSLIAAALGNLVAALLNFMLGDRLIFRSARKYVEEDTEGMNEVSQASSEPALSEPI